MICVLAVLGVRGAAALAIGVGFALGAAVTDSSVTSTALAASRATTFEPLKAAPYAFLALGAAASVLYRVAAPYSLMRGSRIQAGFFLPMAAYLFLGLLGSLRSADPQFALIRWVQATLPFAAAYLYVPPVRRRQLLIAGVLCAALWDAITAVVLRSGDTGQIYSYSDIGITRYGGFVHPDVLAFAGAMLVALGSSIITSSRGRRTLWGPPIIACGVAALVLSWGRAGVAACGAMVILLVLLPVNGLRLPVVPSHIRRATLGASLVLGVILLASSLSTWFARGDPSSLSSLSGRIRLWELVVPEVWNHAIIGWGFGALQVGPLAELVDRGFATAGHAHNAWLQAAVSAGVLGMACWLVAVVWLGYTLLASFAARRDGSSALYFVLWAGAVVNATSDSQLAGYGISWFLLLALAVDGVESSGPRLHRHA